MNDPLFPLSYNVAMSTTSLPWLNLATWRRKKGFTQEQLGNILGVGKSAVSRWESGQRHMNMDEIKRIADIFGIEPMALFLAPDDHDKAQAISAFAQLVDEIGVERATAFIKAITPTQK